MSKLSTKKSNVKGTIAALQTVLERYPVLLTVDTDKNKTSLSFMLDILKILGVTQEEILEWMAGLLTDTKDGSSGLLSVIEAAIKTAILASFKSMYTSSINPRLPDEIMTTPYNVQSASNPIRGTGLRIELDAIDPFGLLNFCPVNKNESIFYFDAGKDGIEEYTPRTIYKSMDFNAYLWYIINQSNTRTDDGRRKCIWDNRTSYYKRFLTPGNEQQRNAFFDTRCENSPTRVIRNVGIKKEFLYCEPDGEFSTDAQHPFGLRVFLNSYRYSKTGITGKNKTIFEFNADYLYSMKLFDAKTLAAQIINAVIGIGNSFNFSISVEKLALTNKIRSIVEKIIESEDSEEVVDCYYTFSNEEYQEFLDAAQLQYDGIIDSGNENGDYISVDTDYTAEQLYKIESAENLEERREAVKNVFMSVANSMASTKQTPSEDKYSFKLNIINKFITEIITQISVETLSPKIMLLYIINEKVMNPDGANKKISMYKMFMNFMKDFQNLLVSIIRDVNEIILNKIFDFLMGQLKPLITLFIQKLLLETVYYYKILLEALLTECVKAGGIFGGSNRNNLEIDNVVGADIVPVLTHPEEGCRT